MKNKTSNEYDAIINVTKVLFNEKDEESLSENEKTLYALFK
ncbi:Uncharacterised protein [Mycoplasmopsis arginini]|nr:Uncharacterised protein [Mycoplasmopsis arginini]SGA25612.1 Uncharacterised protein [Mycoplasmopsis arginini]